MSQHPGKKIGKLAVALDRKKTSYSRASVEVELRFDLVTGKFHAQWEGNWYSASTKDDLTTQIKVAVTKALSLEWRRYIQISYKAEGFPIADARSGRPELSGRYRTFEIDGDRSKFRDGEDTKFAICSIALHWSVCEISEPYALPEDPKRRVRAQHGRGEDRRS